MRGVEATTRQLLIAARQVCSTVQGIHLSETKHTHKFQHKPQHLNNLTNVYATSYCFFKNNHRLNKGVMVSTNLYCMQYDCFPASELSNVNNSCFSANAITKHCGSPINFTTLHNHFCSDFHEGL